MKFKSIAYSFITASLALSLAACSGQQGQNEAPPETMEEMDHTQMESITSEAPEVVTNKNLNTKNVTRLNVQDPIEAAVGVSQMIWPATHDQNRPGTVILSPVENWQISLAGADLIHHPNNGPILFLQNNEIPETTMNEITRLNPTGNFNGTEIMVMGDVDQKVLDQLKDFKVENIKGNDPIQFAKDVDAKYAEVAGELPNSVIIVSAEEDAKLYSLIAANWIAHMPEPVLFVTKDGIPDATKEALALRNKEANMYILGPESLISSEIEQELIQFGKATRISGENPAATSIAFANFKDEATKFGWGIVKPGHGLEFVPTTMPEFAIAGAPFSHLGKHAPMIWLEEGQATNEIHDFLPTMMPTFKDDPTVGPYTHGYLLGSTELVSMETQGMIDLMIEISPEDGGSGHAH